MMFVSARVCMYDNKLALDKMDWMTNVKHTNR